MIYTFFSFSPFFSLIRKFYLLNVDWAKSESAVDRMSLLIKFGSISYVIRFAVQGLARGSKSEIMICGTFSRSKKRGFKSNMSRRDTRSSVGGNGERDC